MLKWGDCFFGLKWPLQQGQASLLEYNWGSDSFVGEPTFLDISSKGITALELYPGQNLGATPGTETPRNHRGEIEP